MNDKIDKIDKILTVKDILKKYHSVEIELLLARVLRKPKEFLYANPAYEIKRKRADEINRMAKRRMRGEPMAYILGYKNFYGLSFKVTRDVLIPRPETEWVVERIRNYEFRIKNRGSLRILDIGTGSGCIIISIAEALSNKYSAQSIQFYASDISTAALAIAAQNSKIHRTKIKFIKSNLLENINFTPDIIIANLPYGWRGVKNRFSSVKDGLKYEPQPALYTLEKGLYHIGHLLEQIAAKKPKPKSLYLEFDPRQKLDLQRLIKKYLPGAGIKFHRDFNNFWRYAEIILN